MVETSAGKKLSAARASRGWSLEDASHATKIRPEMILALESDDFSRFGSAAYAKGFLLIYSRTLGVDVTTQLRDFDGQEARVNVDDYQYLSHQPELEEPARIPARRLDTRRPPSILPLVLFLLLAGMVGTVFWFSATYARLKPAPEMVGHSAVPGPGAGPADMASDLPAPVEPTPEAAIAPVAAPESAADAVAVAPAPAEPLLPQVEQAAKLNELIIEPLKKTWVKIRRDSPDSDPVFEGDIYPGFRPLKVPGVRFYVEVRDQSSVVIRKNGMPIAYEAPNISIQ